jgi:hypothetical protein
LLEAARGRVLALTSSHARSMSGARAFSYRVVHPFRERELLKWANRRWVRRGIGRNAAHGVERSTVRASGIDAAAVMSASPLRAM